MGQVKIIGEIEGFDRVLYDSTAKWEGFCLSVIEDGKAEFQISTDGIDTIEQIPDTIKSAREQVERFILAVEWAFGHELSYKIKSIETPPFISEAGLVELKDSLSIVDYAALEIPPKSAPATLPQIPLEAKRLIQIWTESTKFSDYVEEQLRRQYLIIEELWQEHHQVLDANQRAEKRSIKLIRDFVSHASCCSADVVSLVERDLPSAVEMISKVKHVRFKRTIEHRNYISRFEARSRELTRALVDAKIRQLGVVSGV
ncbi:MAG: hypothetical protein LPK18_00695 [Pseudomonadaceae bacterium]|nr:hypothetical protein [Pseudomonadaceae bacterium]